MARQRQEIKDSITNPFITNARIVALYGLQAGLTFLQQFSLLSLENNLFDVVTDAMLSLESLWDIFRAEITAEMAKQQPHTKAWYQGKALGFMLGVPLINDTDVFDTAGLTDEAIEAAKVVKQAAAVKLISNNGYGILRLKVATAAPDGTLQPVPAEQFAALKYYILEKVVDAGTQVVVTTAVADKLRLHLDIYYSPLILNPEGERLDGTDDTPVQNALDQFLQSIEFNGTLNLNKLERDLIDIEGVQEAHRTLAASKYGDYEYEHTGVPNVGAIDVFRVADGGYLVMDDLQINWIVAE
ncbi:hypothetical protein Q765_00175 [Flavobacterium rivuli WB 3.3-2 = DSM 21788]|uniref:Nucleotidyltransferase n=1 Tax=Flavobacterium rivuli WB 3.3-2 = DSM 21788 TaxID=1121895 RepID=A0A0A2M6U4_9FLAO|nr:hypothetical protein [Flavobacterium rivuli]KGO88372.1 hypothetical protein Q765_00175 [Flavobacterium rivuli WB 3.3-2 = DSM 21788]